MIPLLLLVLPTAGLNCGTVICSDQVNEVNCAEREQDTGYRLNAKTCPVGMQCSAAQVLAWWLAGQGNDVLPCSTGTTPVNLTSSVACPQRQSAKSFQGGKSLILCTQDSDCLLEDNTYTTCLCAFRTDGKGVCQPDPSSYLYWEYWDECGDSLKLDDESKAAYWAQYMAVWAWTQTDNSCAYNLMELAQLEELYTEMVSGAQWLILPFLWT